MKVLVPSGGKTLESAVDPRFARAAYFILADTESGAFEVHDNAQNLNAAQGAGTQAAETVSRLEADVVITAHCGPKAFRALRTAGIQVVTGAQGTVREAMDAFRSGDLRPVSSPDVEGHWA